MTEKRAHTHPQQGKNDWKRNLSRTELIRLSRTELVQLTLIKYEGKKDLGKKIKNFYCLHMDKVSYRCYTVWQSKLEARCLNIISTYAR